MFSKNILKSGGEPLVANKINDGTIISGDVSAQTDLRIDGKILGNITCTSKVVVGATAHISGHIKCNDLTIEGQVKGNLEVNGTLFFRSTAKYEGDVRYRKLIVEEGASISGALFNSTPAAKPATPALQHGTTAATPQTAG